MSRTTWSSRRGCANGASTQAGGTPCNPCGTRASLRRLRGSRRSRWRPGNASEPRAASFIECLAAYIGIAQRQRDQGPQHIRETARFGAWTDQCALRGVAHSRMDRQRLTPTGQRRTGNGPTVAVTVRASRTPPVNASLTDRGCGGGAGCSRMNAVDERGGVAWRRDLGGQVAGASRGPARAPRRPGASRLGAPTISMLRLGTLCEHHPSHQTHSQRRHPGRQTHLDKRRKDFDGALGLGRGALLRASDRCGRIVL